MAIVLFAIPCGRVKAEIDRDTAAVDLRGYGRTSATFSTNSAAFHCQSEEHADILLGKLTADLLWNAGGRRKDIALEVAGKTIPAMEFPPHGIMILGAAGSDVFVLGAPDAASMRNRLATDSLFKRNDLRFDPAKSYPLYLDYYDLKSFKFYVHGMKSVHGEGLASHWEFIRKLGLGGLACQSLGLVKDNPMPGVIDFTAMDYEIKEAERQGGLFVVCPDVGGELPLWMYNKNPDNAATFAHAFLYQGWSHGSVGATYECDGGDGTLPLSSLERLMTRYRTSPNLGGWHLYRGQPIGDNIGVAMNGCMWDHSPVAQKSIRHWLRDVKGYDLPTLGERWFGDAAHFRSWDEVRVPDLADIVGGGYDPDRLLLPRQWQWRKASPEEYGQPSKENGAPWVSGEGPPSQQMAFLPSGSAYYKTKFKAAEWLKARAGRQVKLGCTVYLYENHRLNFWLNGHAFTSQPVGSAGYVSSVTDIPDGILNAEGENELIIQTPNGRSDGRLGGPVFFSDKPREAFPYRDKALNMRHGDALEFQRHSIFARQAEMFEAARRLDPNRPMILSGILWDNIGDYADFSVKNGIGIQYTGRDGFYNPWLPALGNVLGFYASGEPTSTMATPEAFNRTLGFMFYDGDSSFDAFWDVEDYIKLDRTSGTLSNQRRLLQLFGKYLRQKPELLIFRSSLSFRNHSQKPWNWDIGRGEIQGAHYDYGYVSEREIQNGIVDSYPVLFDAGSDIMDKETVSALRRYVESGGTFIALHGTGRSKPLEANSWPIAELTGFSVTSPAKKGNIRFCTEPPVFKGWEGRKFKAKGIAIDCQGNNVADKTGIGLNAESPGTRALALWEDGSIAVGMREIGRGRVIVLGASFWRDAKDVNGRWVPNGTNLFFKRLLTDLGVGRDADASSNRIWVRKVTTKNGLQDWLIAANANERGRANTAETADLAFKVDAVPETVIDMLSGQPVAFKTRPDGWIDIPAVAFSKFGVRVFVVDRPGTVADAISVWWSEKLKYWRKSPVENPPASTVLSKGATGPEAIQFDTWRFLADPDGSVAQGGLSHTFKSVRVGWTMPAFDTTEWKDMPSGSWALLDPALKDYRGIGLYRENFTIPPDWKGHVVTLNLMDRAACGKGDFRINGKRVYEFKDGSFHRELPPLLNFDISNLLDFEGTNTLSVQVEGEKDMSGVCGAVWIAAERVLSPCLDLNGPWSCVMKNYATTQDVSVPGKMVGRFLRRDVEVPAAWAGRQVFLRLETRSNWCGCIVVNGMPKSQAASLSPFGTRTEINITPFIKPGQKNTVEIWPTHSIPTNWRGLGWNWPDETAMEVSSIMIGCEADLALKRPAIAAPVETRWTI